MRMSRSHAEVHRASAVALMTAIPRCIVASAAHPASVDVQRARAVLQNVRRHGPGQRLACDDDRLMCWLECGSPAIPAGGVLGGGGGQVIVLSADAHGADGRARPFPLGATQDGALQTAPVFWGKVGLELLPPLIARRVAFLRPVV